MYTEGTESSPYNAVPDSEPDLGLDTIDHYSSSDCLAQSPPYVPPSPGPLPPLFSIPSPCCYDDISVDYSPPYVPDPIYPVEHEPLYHPATPLSNTSLQWIEDVPKSPISSYCYHEIEPIYVKECVFIIDEEGDIYDGWSIDSGHCTYDYSESLYNKLVDQYEEPRKRAKYSTEHVSSFNDANPKLQSGTVGQGGVSNRNPLGHQLLRKAERSFIKDNKLFDAHSPSEYFKHKKTTIR